MELKRIIAKDGRAATEKAIALYGKDVLVIANNPLDGQTELIVAVQTAGEPALETPAPRPAPAAPRSPNFLAFDEAMQLVRDAAPEVTALARVEPSLDDLAFKKTMLPQDGEQRAEPARDQGRNSDHRDTERLRGREIVDMVRQELAALRQEFKLSRQLTDWESSLNLAPELSPLAQALHDMGVPAGLRGLLLDSIRDTEQAEDALQTMHSLLRSALPAESAAAPEAGIHALCGPSGAGKTLMLARLANAACTRLAPEQVALISFNDARPGAWGQLQLLAAQSGVDCYRARDRAALELLLDELSSRSLVLIDTASTDFDAQAQSLRSMSHAVQLHAVLPVDASITNVRRVLQSADRPWASLMLSKLDEAGHPWPLIQGLTEYPLPLSVVGDAARPTVAALPFDAARLVTLALAPLQDLAATAQATPLLAGHSLRILDTASILGDRSRTEKVPYG